MGCCAPPAAPGRCRKPPAPWRRPALWCGGGGEQQAERGPCLQAYAGYPCVYNPPAHGPGPPLPCPTAATTMHTVQPHPARSGLLPPAPLPPAPTPPHLVQPHPGRRQLCERGIVIHRSHGLDLSRRGDGGGGQRRQLCDTLHCFGMLLSPKPCSTLHSARSHTPLTRRHHSAPHTCRSAWSSRSSFR